MPFLTVPFADFCQPIWHRRYLSLPSCFSTRVCRKFYDIISSICPQVIVFALVELSFSQFSALTSLGFLK